MVTIKDNHSCVMLQLWKPHPEDELYHQTPCADKKRLETWTPVSPQFKRKKGRHTFLLPSLIDVVNQYWAWNTSVSCGEIREALWVTSLSALSGWSEWACALSPRFTATFFSLQVLFLKGMPFLHYLEPKQCAVYLDTMTQKTGRNAVFLFQNVNSSLFPVARSLKQLSPVLFGGTGSRMEQRCPCWVLCVFASRQGWC